MLVSIEPGFRSRDGYVQSDQGASVEERRHRSEQFRYRLWYLALGWQFFQASAKAVELAGHYQSQTYCVRSGGFVL